MSFCSKCHFILVNCVRIKYLSFNILSRMCFIMFLFHIFIMCFIICIIMCFYYVSISYFYYVFLLYFYFVFFYFIMCAYFIYVCFTLICLDRKAQCPFEPNPNLSIIKPNLSRPNYPFAQQATSHLTTQRQPLSPMHAQTFRPPTCMNTPRPFLPLA